MSAAARRKMSRLMKQRWAQGKMKPGVKRAKASKPVRVPLSISAPRRGHAPHGVGTGC